MREKILYNLRWMINSVILAGLIVFFIGLYYWMIKAGIPYQDPPLELQIKYAVNMEIGETLLAIGFIIALYSGLARVILGVVMKRVLN